MKNLAFGIIIATTIFMIIPIMGLFEDPIGLIITYPEVYITLVAIPYALAGALLYFSRKRP